MVPEEGALAPTVVADALDVLGDVPEWRLPPARWPHITQLVQAMTDAVRAGDSAALDAATARLELASPVRITVLGADPVVPPPPQLQLLQNRLYHALDGTVEPLPPEPAPLARADTATTGLVKQILVVHAFAPVDGPGAAAAYARIRQLWAACGDVLGAADPIEALALPATLPAELPTRAAVAARRSAQVQAIVRREHDTVVLSVAAEAPPATWAQWAGRWAEAGAGGDDDPLMAVVTIFAGTVEQPPYATAATARAVAGALPQTPDDFWQGEATALGETVLWQLPPAGDGRRRRLVALADARDEDRLSALVWSRGGTELSPLTQYLLHAAKAAYERRARDAMAPRLTDLPGADPWLEGLGDAVRIARANMVDALRVAGLAEAPTAGPFGADLAAADTLLRQLEFDRNHVRRELAHAPARVTTPATPTIGLVTALPEEFAAMLTLLDGAAAAPMAGDRAPYRRGTVPSTDPDRPHEVVLTLLGETGNDAAAYAVAHFVRSFPSVNQIIMVGIAAGVPTPRDPATHVRLGDLVIGTWNVVDFDHIVDRPDGPERRQEFPRRSALLAQRVKMLTAGELREERPWEAHLDRLTGELPRFARPDDRTDVLFSDDTNFARVVPHPDPARSGHRPGRPKVHEGRIGSSERSVRNAATRDAVARRHQLRAIEMEGKGIGRASQADGRDWFVVRGVSDYGDRWVDSDWRNYAAAVAAAYVRALLEVCPPVDPHGGHTGGAGAGADLIARGGTAP
ncbi:CATRA conflict system CASPASE/TPR repeat-associated protein [Dactylosporangium sp. AC04546]|uniref:CATRA conflict system CASPASE/TPR repeat-associated protein n=1 Tax=Dactylosporangium sp. AC04546 TaxID=2862460 RepID=UPI001EE13C70|nr:CATRA conflict system CASPASE/TPR repeat-associated protein [Dactylosporangium sp. AC04546]WVK88394.1 CATRA conflict system CASPASE/TPR repeat-associated protein [Dactylosporangium sp. AC04546]